MTFSLESSERDAPLVHLFFVILCAIILLIPLPLLIGPRLFLRPLVETSKRLPNHDSLLRKRLFLAPNRQSTSLWTLTSEIS
ncbi:MAG: hypothetical protein ACFFDU_05265 [Candidatus Thorarchaeota archaeon]